MPVTFKHGERTFTNSLHALGQVLNTIWKQIEFEGPTTMNISSWVSLDDTMCSLVQMTLCGVKSQKMAVIMKTGQFKATQLIV